MFNFVNIFEYVNCIVLVIYLFIHPFFVIHSFIHSFKHFMYLVSWLVISVTHSSYCLFLFIYL